MDKEAELSVRRQCNLLSLHRSTAYYELASASEEDLALMRLLDEEYLLHPWKGSRLMREHLWLKSHEVNRKRVQRLMRLMGIAGLNPKRSTSKPHSGHKRYPYLLRNLTVTRANQVWATDISVPQISGVGDERWNRSNGLSRSACRSRAQTTASGCGQKPWS